MSRTSEDADRKRNETDRSPQEKLRRARAKPAADPFDDETERILGLIRYLKFQARQQTPST